MMEIIHKDAKRDDQVLILSKENAELVRQIAEIDDNTQEAKERLGIVKE
jgi:hypothetical protein